MTYRNLEAEQARNNMTDEAVAKTLGVSRTTYIRKKQLGTFKIEEVKVLCTMFKTDFEYLFDRGDAM